MTELEASVRKLQQRFAAATSRVTDEQGLENVRIAYLGRNGEVTKLRRTIGTLPADERPEARKAHQRRRCRDGSTFGGNARGPRIPRVFGF